MDTGAKKYLTTVASSLLSVFFISIMLYVMLGIMEITSHENGNTALIFSVIDFVILFVVIGVGKPIAQKIGVGLYAPICCTTVVYTAAALGVSLALYNDLSAKVFILVKISMLFVYCCIVIPLAVAGSDRKSEETKPEIRKHNL